jgi:hypothetical protein
MAPAPSSLEGLVEELTRQVRQLQARLEAVEKHLGLESEPTPASAEPAEAMPAGVAAPAWSDTAQTTVLVGKSFLGLALAYAFRALTEMNVIPVAAGVALGMAYALSWLVWAARTPAAAILTISLRSLTAVLILVPLLWEAHLRFHAVSSWLATAVLTAFSVAGLVISWRKNLTAVAWITSLAGLIACGALMVKTQDLLPYTCALLLLALTVEGSACLEHYLGERWIVALGADFGVLLMTFVATRPPGTVEGYAPLARGEVLAIQIALVVIYFASTIVRTLGRGFRIANFEIAQSTVALAISAIGAIRVAEGQSAAILTVGTFCAVCGVACCFVSFAFLEHHPEMNRNFHTYAAFGLVLVLAGNWLLLTGTALVAVWSALGLLFVLLGREAGRTMLKAHAAVYLILAAVVSGAVGAANSRFLETESHPVPEPLSLAIWIASGAAVLGYVLLLRGAAPAPAPVTYRAASTFLAANAVWGVAGLASALVGPLCRNIGTVAPTADFCPTLLTGILVSLCLGLALGAARWRRPELWWLSILLALIATYKLLFQDLRQGHMLGVVLSLIVYGGALILLPRLGSRVRAAL